MDYLKYVVPLISLGGVLAAGYYFWYNKRRKRLAIETHTTPLVAAGVVTNGDLEVRIKGRRINNPFLLTIAATNVGHKDIATADFDAQKPVKFWLGSEVIASLRLNNDSDEEQLFQFDTAPTFLLLTPGKIAAGERCAIRLVLDGKPNFRVVSNPLIDTDLVEAKEWSTADFNASIRTQQITGISATLPFILALIVKSIIDGYGAKLKPPWDSIFAWSFNVATGVVVIGAILVLTELIRRGRRFKRIATTLPR
ncbi:hypothetical protein [Mycobacterium sp. SMC-15]|uniref:hypothetical protein n=1 Tax=Mycobacterium sp. SMC-15 TaxID=3381627 RepID=UPI003875CB2B